MNKLNEFKNSIPTITHEVALIESQLQKKLANNTTEITSKIQFNDIPFTISDFLHTEFPCLIEYIEQYHSFLTSPTPKEVGFQRSLVLTNPYPKVGIS